MEKSIAEKYTTIKIPREFTDLIDEILDEKRLGFQSRAEVVKVAVREYYEKMIITKQYEKKDL